MPRVVSIHEYTLKPDVDDRRFVEAIRHAQARGLLRLPGLISHCFVKGLKGTRAGAYAAIWVYESREAWERLWGTPEHPRSVHEYPENWRVWEEEVLAPFLDRHPDTIRFTSYEEL